MSMLAFSSNDEDLAVMPLVWWLVKFAMTRLEHCSRMSNLQQNFKSNSLPIVQYRACWRCWILQWQLLSRKFLADYKMGPFDISWSGLFGRPTADIQRLESWVVSCCFVKWHILLNHMCGLKYTSSRREGIDDIFTHVSKLRESRSSHSKRLRSILVYSPRSKTSNIRIYVRRSVV